MARKKPEIEMTEEAPEVEIFAGKIPEEGGIVGEDFPHAWNVSTTAAAKKQGVRYLLRGKGGAKDSVLTIAKGKSVQLAELLPGMESDRRLKCEPAD